MRKLRILIVVIWVCADLFGQSVTRAAVISRMEEAIGEIHKIEGVIPKVDLLQDASLAMRSLRSDLCKQVIAETFEEITAAAAIIEDSANPADKKQTSAKPSKKTEARDDVFRRFIQAVARYDSSLVKGYVKRYAEAHKETPSSNYFWSVAADTLDDDIPSSLQFASAAAQGEDFPDIGLTYMERLRTLDPSAADDLANVLVSRLSSFSINQRLNLLTYVFPFPRVPELDGDTLFDKDIANRATASTSGATVSPRLISEFVAHAIQTDSSLSASQQLILLELLNSRLQGESSFESAVQNSELSLTRTMPPGNREKIAQEVQRWLNINDALGSSIERSNLAYTKLGDEKFRNRSTLLRALELGRSGDYVSALSLISALPADSKPAATDAVLLYAANVVKQADDAKRLRMAARSATRTPFVLAYVLLTETRILSNQPKFDRAAVASEANELEQFAQQVTGTANQYSIRLGAAALWTRLDQVRARSEVLSLLKDMDDDIKVEAIPAAHMVLSVSGTFMEFNIPTGDQGLFVVIEKLAAKNFTDTIAIASSARSEQVRLKCTVAACAEYLSQKNKRSRS